MLSRLIMTLQITRPPVFEAHLVDG